MAEKNSKKIANKITDTLENISLYAEVIIASLLVLMILSSIGYLVWRLFIAFTTAPYVLGPETIRHELDIVLVIFIIIELFRIATAYYQKKHVLSTVMEAAFIAIAREFVLYDYAQQGLQGAISLSMLLIAVAIAYFFIKYTQKE